MKDPLEGVVEKSNPLPTVYNHDLVMKHMQGHEVTLDMESLTQPTGAPMWGRTGVSMVYCAECDEMVAPISHTPREYDPHCPMCGNKPGMLEHGVNSPEEYHNLNIPE